MVLWQLLNLLLFAAVFMRALSHQCLHIDYIKTPFSSYLSFGLIINSYCEEFKFSLYMDFKIKKIMKQKFF